MASRPVVPTFRPGQVPPGGAFTPMTWPADDPRFVQLSAYTPKVHPEAWPAHRELCIDLVMRTPFVTLERDREIAHTLHRLWSWAAERSFTTTPESLLSGDRIDAFVKSEWRKAASRNTNRTRARTVAALVFPAPPEVAFERVPPAGAHTDQDLTRFLAATASLVRGHKGTLVKRREMHRDMEVILALCFGAGANGREAHRIKESWLRKESDGWWLYRDRTLPTPLADRWVAMLQPHLTGNPDAFLVRPHHLGKRNQQVGKVVAKAKAVTPALGDFDSDRAARWWHRQLIAAAHFPVVAAVGGYQPYTTVPTDLLPTFTITDDADTRALVRGWLA